MNEKSLGGIPCPACHGPTSVKDSRLTTHDGQSAVRRRRRCLKCSFRFTTFEAQPTDKDPNFTRLVNQAALRMLRQMIEGLPLVNRLAINYPFGQPPERG
jgi:hypothetical protein